MAKVLSLVTCCLLAMWTLASHAAPDALLDNAKLITVSVTDYTFADSDSTNCYILAGNTGQAVLIDPADELDIVPGKKILVDTETGVAQVVSVSALAKYTLIARDTVQDPATGKTDYVYDQFRTTETFGSQILQVLQDNHLTLKYIIITHGHLDHIGALTYLKNKTGAIVMMHEADLRGNDGAKQLQKVAGVSVGYPKDSYRIVGLSTKVDRPLHDGDTISLDGLDLQVIHTPGHSPGSICLRTQLHGKPILFSGDTLFHWWGDSSVRDQQGRPLTGDTGRTNFLDGSGDEALLYRMIREKLFVLPDDTVVYPGHYEPTTIGEEKKYSPASLAPSDEQTVNPAQAK